MEHNVLEEPVVSQIVKIFFGFLDPEGSLPCSQQPVIEPFSEPDEYIHQLTSYSFTIHFNIILHLYITHVVLFV
jgi:hypothetical protein